MGKYTPKAIRRILNNPKAPANLCKCIQSVYKSLGYFEQRQVDQLSAVIKTNLQKKRGMGAGKYEIGTMSLAELGIRLAILMMELDMDADGLKHWIRERGKNAGRR